jgi:hypothetical protein
MAFSALLSEAVVATNSIISNLVKAWSQSLRNTWGNSHESGDGDCFVDDLYQFIVIVITKVAIGKEGDYSGATRQVWFQIMMVQNKSAVLTRYRILMICLCSAGAW